jgi:competence protein ComEC
VGEGAKRVTTGASDIEDLVQRAPDAAGGGRRRLNTRLPRLPSLSAAGASLRDQLPGQADRWFLWAPVAFGGGCAIYLSLPAEPGWWVPALVAGAMVATAILVRRWHAAPRVVTVAATLAAFLACGVLAGKLRTMRIEAPLIAEKSTGEVSGWVVDVASPGKGGGRLVIAPYAMDGFAREALPRRVRVTVGPDGIVGPGSAVRVRALLNPSPGPASPGSYDFARDAFFRGIGGTGFSLGDAMIIDGPPPPPGLRIRMAVNAARWSLGRRIAERLGPQSAGLGVAMVTGHEAWMTEETEAALRDSGLAHIISISGMHMAIVGGFVFLLIRTLVAAWPWLALRASGKKIAAAAALLAIGVYLVVSGAPPPAIRSAVTLSVAFVAVLLDRQALTLHSLAVAALIVLVLQPEAVGQPGFQMSFSATAALLALAEAWPRPIREINTPWPIRLVQKFGAWLAIATAASLVAGLATGPFATQHFNRVALWGLPANLLTEPLSVLVILPCLALGALCEAIGLPDPFLPVAGWGIQALIGMGGWFAGRPNAVLTVASAPSIALPIAFLGVLWVCLWKGWARWLGLPAALAVAIWPRTAPPAAWIAADGGGAAIAAHGEAIPLRPEAKAFATEVWARRRGLELPKEPKAARDARFDCNRQRCWPAPGAPDLLSAWWTRRAVPEADLWRLCSARIVILKSEADSDAVADCPGRIVLRPAQFAAGGAVEIYPAGQGWRFVWSQPLRGRRPWSQTTGD